jgi:hypothetical protein
MAEPLLQRMASDLIDAKKAKTPIFVQSCSVRAHREFEQK